MIETPALEHLLAAYFHQDWMLDDADEWAVLGRFLTHEPQMASRLVAEIHEVLDKFTEDDDLRDFTFALGSYLTLPADDGDYRGWLTEVARRAGAAADHDGRQ